MARTQHFNAPCTPHSLRSLVMRLHHNTFWREDLVQEAMIHIWSQEVRFPGQSWTWYLRSCELHLRNLLRKGCSLDSLKRSANAVGLPSLAVTGAGKPAASEQAMEGLEDTREGASVTTQVAVRDLIRSLMVRLTQPEQQVLECLLLGLTSREAARRLHISHTLVNRRRRCISLCLTRLLEQ